MNRRQELVQQIGEHVVSNFEKWNADRKGRMVMIPVSIPRDRELVELKRVFPNFSEWLISVSIEAPMLIKRTGIDVKDWHHMTMEEYFQEIEQMKSHAKKVGVRHGTEK